MMEVPSHGLAADNSSGGRQIPGADWKTGASIGLAVEGWTLRNPVIASLVWVGLLFGFVLCLYTPSYETNDDVLMSMIASGTGVNVSPDEHLVFTHVLIGLLLKQLYTNCPSIPWYALYLLSINYLAHVAVVYALLVWHYRRVVVVSYFLLFATVGVVLITKLQFTSTAVWATECGLFVALNGLLSKPKNYGGSQTFATGLALMVLGSLVRFDSYLAALAISIVPLTVLVWQLDRKVDQGSRIWKSGLALIVVSQCAAFGLHSFHHAYYTQNPEWREFLAFNPYRVKFNDYCWTSYTEDSQFVFQKANWTKNDHSMITSYFYDDPDVFGRDKLQTIIEGFSWGTNAIRLKKIANWWKEILLNPLLWPIWMTIAYPIQRARNPRFVVGHFLLLTVWIDAVIFGLMLLKNPPSRVYYPLFAFQSLYLLILLRCEVTPKLLEATESMAERPNFGSNFIRSDGFFLQGRLPQMSALIAILGISLGQLLVFRCSNEAVSGNRQLHADIARIDPQQDELFICWGDRFPYESILPLESPDAWRNLHLYCLGWLQQSPINDTVKKRFGIDRLAVSMVEKPGIYVLGSAETNRVYLESEFDYYRTFVRERYQLSVKWEKQFSGSQVQILKPASVVIEAANGSTATRWR